MSTAAAATGAKLPNDAGEDSYNLLPALLGTTTRPIRDAIVHHSNGGMFGSGKGSGSWSWGLGRAGSARPRAWSRHPAARRASCTIFPRTPASSTTSTRNIRDVVDRLSTLLEKYKSQGYSRPM